MLPKNTDFDVSTLYVNIKHIILCPWTDEPALNGRATLPPYFDDGEEYPVLVYVYAGPNSQVVS